MGKKKGLMVIGLLMLTFVSAMHWGWVYDKERELEQRLWAAAIEEALAAHRAIVPEIEAAHLRANLRKCALDHRPYHAKAKLDYREVANTILESVLTTCGQMYVVDAPTLDEARKRNHLLSRVGIMAFADATY